MDSGEINKILGGVIGALLVFLLLGFFSELIYIGPGHEGEEDRVLAFAVEVEETGGEAEEEVIDYGALLAAADASEGASVFNKCQACHNLEEGANAVGPHLAGVVGRDIASVEGFDYSPALLEKEGAWGLVTLFNFIHNPSGWAPGTKMGFAGLPDNQDKVDLIVYLNEESGSPVELVAPEMPEQPAGEAAAAEGEGEGEGAGHAELIAAADPAAGESVFRKCQACHRVEEGANAVGPHLWGVVGRDIASVEGFAYSDALAGKEGTWDFDRLFEFIHDPQGWAPGTKMSFAGIDDEQDRADVIAYLNQQSDSPIELAAAPPAEEADAVISEAEGAEGEEGPVAAAAGADEEEELLGTADEAGLEDTAERDAEDKGVPSQSSPVKEVELKDEEEAEAAAEAIDEPVSDDAEGYSEQRAGTDEVDTELVPEGEAAPEETDAAEPAESGAAETEAAQSAVAEEPAEAAEGGEPAAAEEPGAKAAIEPEAVVDPEVETETEVQADTTSALTEILDEERVDPLPENEGDAAEAEPREGAEEGAAAETAEDQQVEASGESGGEELAALLASATVEEGEEVFRVCSACHQLEEGANGIGPYLHGVVGREIASAEGYSYSEALAGKEGTWDPATLDAFLADPQGWAPGNKMSFPGLDDPQERASVIRYLNQASDAPMDLGAAPAPVEQAALGSEAVAGAPTAAGDADERADAASATPEGTPMPGRSPETVAGAAERVAAAADDLTDVLGELSRMAADGRPPAGAAD